MPLLANFIGALFTGLATWLATFFTKQVALRVTAGAALVTVLGLLMVAFNAALAPLVGAAFQTQYGQFMGLAFPPAAGTCLATITGTWVGCTTYKLQERIITMTASV